MVIRNIVRIQGRTAVGVFAACMGAALLTTGFMLRCGVEYIIEFQFEKVLRSDVDLAFKDEDGWDALQDVPISCRASNTPNRCWKWRAIYTTARTLARAPLPA